MRRTKHQKEDLLILTCDPSITAWGWAVCTLNGKVLEHGCIQTKPDSKKKNIRKSDDRCRRVTELNSVLLEKIHEYQIQFIVSEAPHGSQSAVSAIMIGIVFGMLQTIADTLAIPIEWYSESESKKCVLGRQGASKQDMVDAVCSQMQITLKKAKYYNEAVADALAVFLTAKKHSVSLKLLNR